MRASEAVPPEITLPQDLPFLESLSWSDRRYRDLPLLDILRRYESGWRHLGVLADPSRQNGYAALFTAPGSGRFRFPREMRIDQYGIRFVVCGDESLKVELIREARIDLDPGVRPGWSPGT
jgi:hypothetical protein